MFDTLLTTYNRCLDERLSARMAQIHRPLQPEQFWEKTLEALYISSNPELTYAALLDDSQEAYGDLLASYNNKTWALVEFKQTISGRHDERDKYIRTNKNKYANVPGRPHIMAQHEIAMFESFVNHIGAPQSVDIEGRTSWKREPHFFVYSPVASKHILQLSDLRASLYWGEWATKNQKWAVGKPPLVDYAVGLHDIPLLAADYESFARYAGCVKLAKSGVFTYDEAADGGGGLVDLSLVLGIAHGQVEVVTTFEVFLAVQQQIAEFTHQQTAQNAQGLQAVPPPDTGGTTLGRKI